MNAKPRGVTRLVKSFHFQLTFAYFLMALVVGTVAIGLWLYYWNRTTDYTVQYLYNHLAQDLKRELEPLLVPPIDQLRFHQRIHELQQLNREIDVYLLDEQGRIVYSSAAALRRSQVALEPIRRFIDARTDTTGAVYGDDPLKFSSQFLRDAVFSATRISLGDGPGYLYVILRGSRSSTALGGIGTFNAELLSIRMLALAVVVCTVVGYAIFRLMTRRFTRMTSTIEHFREGDFAARIDPGREDEIGLMARAFNEMAVTIEQNIQQLSDTDRQRRELVAAVSHDLRGPLTCICGFLEILDTAHRETLSADVNECIAVIRNNVEVLRRLALSMFELSSLEAREVAPAIEPFQIEELADEVLIRFRNEAAKRGVSLVLEAPDELPTVAADLALLDRVLTNLVDNALRYTPAGGTITIHLSEDSGGIAVAVRDTGIGIAEKHLPHLFERFYRADENRAKDSGGSGLGLAIVRRIIEVHGSSIGVESELGKGTVFRFMLQRSAAHGETAPEART